MIKALISFVVVTVLGFPLSSIHDENQAPETQSAMVSVIPSIYPQIDIKRVAQLLHSAPELSEPVVIKVVTALKCAAAYRVNGHSVLSVIDYSLPSNQKRLWVFDLNQNKLLFHTYVSHGIKSGALLTSFFSNKFNSKASSIGIYKTNKSYYGREGLSLRLDGLDRNFNDNAQNRSIVMHGGWYMEEAFIKKYGRPGRSWGCPALPLSMYQSIINTIKDNTLMVVYYPNEKWFASSKFLTCDKPLNTHQVASSAFPDYDDHREDVLFAQVHKGGEDMPILAVSATNYMQLFNTSAPLTRMLRRQINQEEFVALSRSELDKLVGLDNKTNWSKVNFVIPTLHMVRGYYETKMQIVNLGTIKGINMAGGSDGSKQQYTIRFETTPTVYVKPTGRFIRWVGL